MNTNFLVIMLMILTVEPGFSKEESDSWLNSPRFEKEIRQLTTTHHLLNRESYAEVRIIRIGTAISQLKDKSFAEITDKVAEDYLGVGFKSLRRGKADRLYLVRGGFCNYTGDFLVYWNSGNLLVLHHSLGDLPYFQRCPLVVSLPAPPKNVIVHITAQ